MVRPVASLALLTILAIGASDRGLALEPSGTAVAVLQSADVVASGNRRLLQVAAPLFSGDRVNTGAQGEAQLRFRDQTRMVVGANSSLLIDRFVFNPDNTAQKISINAIKGAFRFITGQSAKRAYTITTPSATIGVRGTRFDFTVANGVTTFALFEGGARVCSRRGECVELRGSCEVAIIPAGNAIKRLPGGAARSEILAASFPYVRSQSRLLPDFRADTSSCAISKADINSGQTRAASLGAPDPGTDPGTDPGGGGTDPGTPGGNRSGLGDGTNPGQGAAHSQSGNNGSNNPGNSSP